MTYYITQNIDNAQTYAIYIHPSLEDELDILSTAPGWLVFQYEAYSKGNPFNCPLIRSKASLSDVVRPYFNCSDILNAYKVD